MTTTLTEKYGKILFDSFQKSRGYKEAITTSNSSALYVTVIADAIRGAPAPKPVLRQALQTNTDAMASGTNSVKLPMNKLATASSLTEGSSLTYVSDGYSSITVTTSPIGAASKLTLDIQKAAGPSLILNEATRMKSAIERKVESDIITALASATSDSNANGHDNQIETGGTSTDMDYADLIAAQELIQTYYGDMTDIFLHPADYNALLNDTDFKNALYRATSPTGEIMPNVPMILGAKINISGLLTDGTAYCVDRNNLGSLCLGSNIEVEDVPVADSFDKAVGAYQFVGVGIQNEDMVVEIVKAA